MKKKLLGVFIPFISIALLFSNCKQTESKTETLTEEQELSNSIERGQYLVTLMDCNNCHTPKVITDKGPAFDTSRLLSGFPSEAPLPEMVKSGWILFHPELTATVGPWGVSFSSNITPHSSGIGSWTLEQFDKALRGGKHKGLDDGRMLLPPMPWQSYSKLTDKDLEAIFNYLQTVKPIDNVVPQPLPPTEI